MREKAARRAFVAMNGYEPSDDAFEGLMAPKSKSGMALAVTDAVLDALLEPTEEMCLSTGDGPNTSRRVFTSMVRAAKEGK